MQLSAVAFRGTSRFRLVRLLGRGGMGVVYEAFDEANAVPVALKLLPVVNPDLLLRFKREFRAVADVRHPNLVRLGELVSEGSQWFFTMELVKGIDLGSYVRGGDPARAVSAQSAPFAPPRFDSQAPTVPGGERRGVEVPAGSCDEGRLRAALGQLARALAALHAARCVHRDVKPTNVLVTAEGRVVLLDFGLVRESAAETTFTGAGTPEYMAPEQAAQATVTGAADWYAFGVILFELLSGRLPFPGLPHEILYRKQYGRPPRLSEIAPEAPADLAAACDGLLEPDPERRWSAAQVFAAFGVPVPAASEAAPGATPTPRADGSGARPSGRGPAAADEDLARVVGREAERGELARLLAEVRASGGARAAIVRGESGVGKSTLIRAFLDEHAAGEDVILLDGRCYERELLPFKAVDGIVDALTPLLRKADAETLERVIPQRGGVLLQAFPVLGRIPAFAQLPQDFSGLDPGQARASMFAAFRELLRALGERAVVVMFIDDLQWADADSLALLSEALRPPESPRLFLVATVRAAAGEELARLFAGEVVEHSVELGNLDEGAARALASDLLRAGGAPDADAAAAVIARESGGHPLFLQQLARTLHLPSEVGKSLTLDGLLGTRMRGLSPSAGRALRALAIARAPVPVRTLRRLLALDGAATLELVDHLRSERWIHSAADRGDELVDIAHDRIRQVAQAATTTDDARELHEGLAEAFEDAGASFRAAVHWREAGQLERAAVHFAAAGQRAAEALAFDRAAQHYETALGLSQWSGDRRRELLVGLADALASAGRGAEAAPHYLEAARNAAPLAALDLRRRAAEELLRSGRLDEGRVVAREALAAAGLGFSRSPVRALVWQRVVLRSRGLRFRRRAAEDIAPRDLARADVCWALSSGLAFMDPVQGAHFQARSLVLALRAGEPYRVARGIAGEAAYAAAQGDKRRARALLAEAGRIAASLEAPHGLGIVALMSGLAGHLGGEFGSALAHLDAAERNFRERCVGTAWELDAVRQFTLECCYYLGELQRYRVATADGLKEAKDRGSVYVTTTLRTGLANAIWLLRDEPAEARADAATAMRGWSADGYHVQHWYELIAQTQVDLYSGDGPAAHARVTAGWPALRRSNLLRMQHTRIVATHLRARAALAAAAAADAHTGRRASLLALARSASARLERERNGWATAFSALLNAGVDRLEGRPERSAEWLRRAMDECAAHGLQLFKAAAEIAAAPGGGGERWMAEGGVRAPSALARMLVPALVA
jgi:hypothetical protein